MAEEAQTVELQTRFYRDSFGKVLILILSICFAIALFVSLAIYIHLQKPKPIQFNVGNDWRVIEPVPLDQPYLSQPDLLQWVNDAIQKVFVFDFYHYNDQLQKASQYFTSDGWKVFLNQLNNYVNYNNVQTYKTFINAVPTSAPYILREGLLEGRYGWWVQMPITLNYIGYQRSTSQNITLQILVVRVSTLNNLNGVGIDNVMVVTGAGNQPGTNG